MITDRFPAEHWQEGFDAARAATGGKVVLDWSAISPATDVASAPQASVPIAATS